MSYKQPFLGEVMKIKGNEIHISSRSNHLRWSISDPESHTADSSRNLLALKPEIHT